MRRIVSRAPARVDLAGGSLDLWPVGLLVKQSMTVNAAISLAATVTLEESGGEGVLLKSIDLNKSYRWFEDSPPGKLSLVERLLGHFGVTGGWTVVTRSDAPAGSGLGGSSSLAVALSFALAVAAARPLGEEAAVSLCRDIEAMELGMPTGVQDHWPAVKGGILALSYAAGATSVEVLDIPLKELAERLVVVYSGKSRLSANSNWSLYRSIIEREGGRLKALQGIAEVAVQMRHALLHADFDTAGLLLGEEMALRKGLSKEISTPHIEHLISAAMESGAVGGKVCGAGGGGCLVFIVSPGRRTAVEEALERLGATILAAHPVERGCQVEVQN
ncbi:MAG: hypothetical protein P8Z49_11520 [Acidobacteriota bacterium]